MFSDFYEKFNFNKTTPEEKKEVVENTGKYFPNEHSNKIKGIDELAEAVVNNAMKTQNEILGMRPAKEGYTWKKCKKCGKVFESCRNAQKYCSKECADIALKENQKRYEMKRIEMRKEESKYKYCAECGKAFVPSRKLRKYCCEKCAKDVMNRRQREAYRNKYSINRANFNEPNEAPENKPITHVETVEIVEPQNQPQPQPQHEEDSGMKYLALMQKALNIVSIVKSTSDVKKCINEVFDVLNK